MDYEYRFLAKWIDTHVGSREDLRQLISSEMKKLFDEAPEISESEYEIVSHSVTVINSEILLSLIIRQPSSDKTSIF